LRNFIGAELGKKDKKYARKRPDFACGTLNNEIIIIEIKRPSHELTVEDLNQVELYVRLADKYKKNSRCSAFLIGNKESADLEETMKYRIGIKVKTYLDLLDDCKMRYKKFLENIQKGQNFV
jgi:hypothetical protein